MGEDNELDGFKRIDLRVYAASVGYALDRKDSWRGSAVMRRGGDKIVVKLNANGHYVYFSVREDGDSGTIIDFIQHRQNLSLGEVRKELRRWTGRPAPSSSLPMFPKLAPATKDRLRVETEYARMREAPGHPYLLEVRRIPPALLSSRRFAGRVRIDGRGNAVFPHFDHEGLCGYEIKNQGFTGFASGGEKGLWVSRSFKGDARLVMTESAIDALSYAALFPDTDDKTRYASIGGKPNPKQPTLMKASFARLPAESSVVAAFDADAAGRELADLARALFESFGMETGRTDLKFQAHLPAKEGDDWNQMLQDRPAHSFPIALNL